MNRLTKDWKPMAVIALVFTGCFFLPVGAPRFDNALREALELVRWYAREHVLLCLVPAFFIAGAIGVFISQAAVMRYLGAGANKVLAYGVASVSGTILAVCSCTVLPLFGGIYKMGAGLGPATTFLYSGPAINVLAIVMTARVLGIELGIARAVGAILFSIVIGLLMEVIFQREETEKARVQAEMPVPEAARPLWKTAAYFASMVLILVFANWGGTGDKTGVWHFLHANKWMLTSVFGAVFGVMLVAWFRVAWWRVALTVLPTVVLALAFPHLPLLAFGAASLGLVLITGTSDGEMGEWWDMSWGFAKQILPLLLAGVFVAGFLLGRPGEEGIIPSAWVNWAVGGNSLTANFLAAILGAFMYFATLTEIPILQGLLGSGMGKGPALALLLAGPALSLPSMLVIQSIMGTKKTVAYCLLVVAMSTVCGMLYGFVWS
ncbi:MAG: hypothetical protein GX580_11115 [Candidatus Hydrogenedens sp.]|nr:permease [Candidatus Hydrogenedentota bacterium]NLF58178.1 hypothetical protein [Candidatus Hydrogenedens sp.]